MPKWTPQQNNAITARGRNILVSAAAGSGKTAVLVERVIKKITDSKNPVDIDKLLIVTFTNNAASEMKFRITKSLKEILRNEPFNQNAQRQLNLMPNAKICTIDSFCINLVRENFFELGINQDFTNLDENEASLLEDEIINSLTDELFENNDEEFIKLVEQFNTPGNEKPFINAVKKVRRFIYAQPFPYSWAYKMSELYNSNTAFENSKWFEYIKDEADYLISIAKKCVNNNLALLNQIDDSKLNEKFENLFLNDKSLIDNVSDLLNTSWDDLVKLGVPSFARLVSTAKLDEELASEIKANRNTYTNIIKKEIPAFLICSKEDYVKSLNTLYPIIKKLIDFVKIVDARLMVEKNERNSYSFSDTEHFAINLLFTPDGDKIIKKELADRLSAEFEEILVDEYQDTNEAQDLLFAYLSNGHNLFTVGDVKQSIYRFRLAMPNIFNSRRKLYTDYNPNDNEKSSKIILDKNFRSSKGICEYVNFIFSKVMSERVGELDYDAQNRLNFGADYKKNDIPSAQIHILDGAKGEETDTREAMQIAKLIRKKIDSKEQIKDGDEYRDIRYSDFAILFRSMKNHVDSYVKVFTDMSIPVQCDNSSNLFENNEIKLILSLLRTIDNPTKDISLLSTMMSPVYAFTADELAQIRIENKRKNFYFSVVNSQNEKVLNFLEDIKNLKKLSVTMSVSNFIRYLVENKGIVAFINAMGNGEQRYQNILALISFAQKFDSGVNIGLTSFIRYIDKIIDTDKGIDSKSIVSGKDDAVTIMTVHHSKGLEFPICVLAGAARSYNTGELTENLLINTVYGFGLKVHNEERMYNIQSIPYSVIKSKSANELMSENLRVLYVAMTRAKEQFITFISCQNIERKMQTLYSKLIAGEITPYAVKSCKSDADIILLCSLFHQNAGQLRELAGCRLFANPADFDMSIDIDKSEGFEEDEIKPEKAEYQEGTVKEIAEKLSYKYDYSPLSNVTSKMTASSLDDSDTNFEYITSSKPAFMNKAEMTPAMRGTAMHTFMQFCNYNLAKDNLDKEIENIVSGGFITEEQGKSLDKKRLASFFNSPLAKRMFNSDKIYREIKVSTFLSANEVYGIDFDDKILVQGIADCVFEESGQLVLVDYKTDRVKDENELLERYKKQLTFYKYAIEKTLKMPVKEAMLYSFYLEKECIYK
jgi:ATP-dependent helicase/nuclease subunit A